MSSQYCRECGSEAAGSFCASCGATQTPGVPEPRRNTNDIRTPLGNTNIVRIVVIAAIVIGVILVASMMMNAVSSTRKQQELQDSYCESFGSNDPNC